MLVGTGIEARQAYSEAFEEKPKDVAVGVALLLGEPQIVDRIKEVQERILKETALDRIWLLSMVKQGIQESAQKGQWTTAFKGIELIGRVPELDLFPRTINMRRETDVLADLPWEKLYDKARQLGLIPAGAKPPEDAVIVVEPEGTQH